MITIKRAQLFILVLLFWTKGEFCCISKSNSLLYFEGGKSNKKTTLGSLEKKSGNKHHKKKTALLDKKTARSALVGIKPEEILTIGNGG